MHFDVAQQRKEPAFVERLQVPRMDKPRLSLAGPSWAAIQGIPERVQVPPNVAGTFRLRRSHVGRPGVGLGLDGLQSTTTIRMLARSDCAAERHRLEWLDASVTVEGNHADDEEQHPSGNMLASREDEY